MPCLAADAVKAPCKHCDNEDRFLLLPLADQHRETVLDFCRDDAEGDWQVIGQGGAVLFARASDHAFASFLAL